ncbi:MAG: metallophosphoesterase [candidate division WOR-3 bacterium]
MKIIGITDIHGRANIPKAVAQALAETDLILIAGDITNFGGKEETKIVMNAMRNFNEKILAVPGNCDHQEVIEELKSEGINLHGEIRRIDTMVVFGIGGSGYTPFNTPQEYSDSEIERILEIFKKEKTDSIKILVSHSPPLGTSTDRTMLGIHAGNGVIRKFITDYQPDLCLCGHIHEARGTDKIGKTIIINPGPFPKFYVEIEITDKIRFSLKA